MTDTVAIKSPKKLIEVGLPLDKINAAAAREKNIRHGHPSTLHLWWARRPLAAARAVIFAQLVNDPSWKWELEHPGEVPPGHLKASWANSRKRLFALLEQLVSWENVNNAGVLERATAEIRRSWVETCELNRDHPEAATLFNPAVLPALHDPFAGGGAIPLEAQRLGLSALATDLNPIAVLINKAMIELPPKFSGQGPVNPKSANERTLAARQWRGAQGLAEDVRYYGDWMRAEAEKRIGHLYPKIEVTPEIAASRPDLQKLIGQKLTVVAWIWARTVRSPNPAFRHISVPLVSNYILSPMAGKAAYIQPIVEGDGYRFEVRLGDAPANASSGNKLARGSFECVMSRTPFSYSYIDDEANAGRMGTRLMAIVAEGQREKIYLSPTAEMEEIAKSATPDWRPETPARGTFASNAQGRIYGFKTFADYFTSRQLVALGTFADLVSEARSRALEDSVSAANKRGEKVAPDEHEAYADAIAVYLSFLVNKLADKGSSLCTWDCGPASNKTASGRSARVATVRVTFGRQAIQMSWDFAEVNFFSESTGSIDKVLNTLSAAIENLPYKALPGQADQIDAKIGPGEASLFVSTDPPYYDNIGYADLSDFFYVWSRRSLRSVFPTLLSTMASPKADELVATHYRHGSKEAAEEFFLNGMTIAIRNIALRAHPSAPVTIYYAFKQSETKDAAGTSSTGWETFLEAVCQAGLTVTGTWPMRTEMSNRLVGSGANALASSIVLVCRMRPPDAPSISRRAFVKELNAHLPEALDEMTRGSGEDVSPVAPVDLSQAIIGPGMAIYSKYSEVLEADGSRMNVNAALKQINRFLAEDDFDADTQFCLHWFEQHGWNEGAFGEADQLARAKGTAVNGMKAAGVIEALAGKVRLLRWPEYSPDWNPATDDRMPVWEILHQLIRLFKTGGEGSAGGTLSKVSGKSDAARQLAYRLYTLCERSGWTDDARAYNELIASWSAIEDAAAIAVEPTQTTLFDR